MTNQNSCHHCEGKGYLEIRDCSGEIQRSETCSFCGGTGYIEEDEEELEGDRT
jgi:DnaJ-class molecular chaperone